MDGGTADSVLAKEWFPTIIRNGVDRVVVKEVAFVWNNSVPGVYNRRGDCLALRDNGTSVRLAPGPSFFSRFPHICHHCHARCGGLVATFKAKRCAQKKNMSELCEDIDFSAALGPSVPLLGLGGGGAGPAEHHDAAHHESDDADEVEIGRASCRERV